MEKMISIRLDGAELEWLRAEAQRRGGTVAGIARDAIVGARAASVEGERLAALEARLVEAGAREHRLTREAVASVAAAIKRINDGFTVVAEAEPTPADKAEAVS